MAWARCDDHQPGPADEHGSYALPLGYPSTAVTCDVIGCAMPARVWLSDGERAAFVGGVRVFPVPNGPPVRVSDDLFPD
jgi:hypothetical protein